MDNNEHHPALLGRFVIVHHRHHRDAKRLAGASRRCDRSPEWSVLR